MTDSQRKILESRESKYLSIGITHDGSPRGAISIPWERTVSAYNMRTPDVFLSPEDLKDPAILALLGTYVVNGCYIFDPLEDYSFLADFKDLWDVHIRHGGAITDLSFMKDLDECFMFYIEDASMDTLEPIFPEGRKKGCRSYCMGFVNCRVKDISAFERKDLYLSELVIIQPQGTNERERWKNVRAGTYTYYEYK